MRTVFASAGLAALLIAGGVCLAGSFTVAPAVANDPGQGRAPAASPFATRTIALGRVEPISELVKVAGPTGADAARISEIRFTEGDWVEQGAILALLDTRGRLEAALAQAEATVALRQASLVKLRADLDVQERTLLAAVEQQEAQRDRARWEFDRLQQLQRSGLYRDTALIDKKLALDAAERVMQSARFTLDRNRVRDAEGRRIDEAAAMAEVAAADAALAKARADLAFTEIRAPNAGRVLRRFGRVGEQLGQDGLAEMADTRVMMVRAEVFESDMRRVATGARVEITSRAFDGVLQGRVHRIGFKVSRQSIIGEDPASSLDARVVEVLIRLDTQGSERLQALSGLQVRVGFFQEQGS
jgi:HlyD family secretion protein